MYTIIAWGNSTKTIMRKLQVKQNLIAKIMCNNLGRKTRLLPLYKSIYKLKLGAVHKERPQLEAEEVVQCGHFADKGKGFFRCLRPHFLAQKTWDFSKFMVCPQTPHWQGGLSQCGQEGRRSHFFAICTDVLYGRPLAKFMIRIHAKNLLNPFCKYFNTDVQCSLIFHSFCSIQ